MDLAPRLWSHSPKIEKIVEAAVDKGAKLDPSAMPSAPSAASASRRSVDTILLDVLKDGLASG